MSGAEGGALRQVPCIECEGREGGCETCVGTGWLYAKPPRVQVAPPDVRCPSCHLYVPSEKYERHEC